MRRLAANGLFLAILLGGMVAATVTGAGYLTTQRSVARAISGRRLRRGQR